MKLSLSAKMLLLTLGSFLLLIFGIIASLYLYFNRFYEPEKINQMINAINKFSSELEDSQWTDEKLYSEVSKFMKNQNVTMSIQPQLAQLMIAPTNVVLKADPIPDYFVLESEFSNTSTISPLTTISITSMENTFPYAVVSSANIDGNKVH